MIGILFLAAEIQQSNRIAKATTEIEIRNAYGVLNEGIHAEEDLRMRAWLTQAVNQWIAIEQAYENQMTPKETFGVVFDDQAFLIETFPALRSILREIVKDYSAVAETQVIRSLDQLLASKGA